jgi:hypothetical protein
LKLRVSGDFAGRARTAEILWAGHRMGLPAARESPNAQGSFVRRKAFHYIRETSGSKAI